MNPPAEVVEHLKRLVRDVPDFPQPGILFRDVTPLLRDPAALAEVVESMAAHHYGDRVDAVAGIESRGFILGAPLAIALGVGFVPVRKLGKLPGETARREYALEYGTNVLEVHRDAVHDGERVLVVDDLLATGGTAAATVGLVEELGGEVVGCSFLIELEALGGREALAGREVSALIRY